MKIAYSYKSRTSDAEDKKVFNMKNWRAQSAGFFSLFVYEKRRFFIQKTQRRITYWLKMKLVQTILVYLMVVIWAKMQFQE